MSFPKGQRVPSRGTIFRFMVKAKDERRRGTGTRTGSSLSPPWAHTGSLDTSTPHLRGGSAAVGKVPGVRGTLFCRAVPA